MAKYLTVDQYKRYGDGVSLAGVSDVALAGMIARAEADIDAHMGFEPRRGGYEPHFVMIQQAFREHTRKTYLPDYPIPVRQITRYRIQVSNISSAGAGFFANINPGDCVINQDGGYVEIIPLQAITFALAPVIIELGLDPPIVEMDCEVGYYIPRFGETVYSEGDNQTYFSQYGFWATTYTQALHIQPNQVPPIPAVVYKNGSVVDGSLYTTDPVEGKIVFTTPNSNNDVVSLDYTYTIPTYVTNAAVYQTSHLIARSHLHELGLYDGLMRVHTVDVEISYPRMSAVADKGRATDTPLCDKAAACFGHYEPWGVA